MNLQTIKFYSFFVEQKYIEECAGEEELNDQLNVFAENYAYVYGGRNDIKTQIGFDSLDGMSAHPYDILWL